LCILKEKLIWKEKFLLSLNHRPSFLLEESLPHAIIMVSLGTSNLNVHIGKFLGRQIGRLLKLPCVTNVELAVMSGLGVLHLKRSHPGIMDLYLEIPFQGISSSRSLLQQKKTWVPKKLCTEKQKTAERFHTISGQISGTATNERRTGQGRGHPLP
jgi:hypothetical protein